MDTKTLTRRQIIELNNAHQQLDGPKDSPFRFSAKVRYNLAKNLRILRDRAEDIHKVQTAVIREVVPPGTKAEPGSPQYVEVEAKLAEFLAGTEDVNGLLSLTLADLQLDLNSVPISVLCALAPLVKEDVA